MCQAGGACPRSATTWAWSGATSPSRTWSHAAPTASEADGTLDLQPAVRPGGELVPARHDALAELRAAPVPGALLRPVGREEELRLRPRKRLARPARQRVPVGHAHRHAVGQPVAEVGVDGEPHVAVPRHVHVGGRARAERVHFVVGHGAPVHAQALDELPAARRGEPHQVHVVARGEQVRDSESGLARGAADDHRPAFGQSLVAEHVVDQEGGGEQRAQHHLQVLGALAVEGVRVGALVALVGGGQGAPMLRLVPEPAGVGGRGHDEVRGRRQVAVHPRAALEALGPALAHLGEAPHRHPPPALRGGEEVPVGHGVAEHRIGDVVGGQAEAVDLQQRLTLVQLGRLGARRPRRPDVAAVDEEVRHGP